MLQNWTKGAETRSSKPAIHRKETTLKRNFQKLTESPSVRYESVGRGFESLPSHQEKPVHIVCWFFFFVCAMEGARTGRRRIAPQAISPVGCCLARGFQRVGMSTVEAVNRKISWLFCFSGRICTLLHISCTLYKKAMLPYAIFYPSFFFFFNSFPEILTHKDGFRGSLFFGKNDLHSSVECGWEPWVRRLRTK